MVSEMIDDITNIAIIARCTRKRSDNIDCYEFK